jgi:hypothetical protein
MTDLRAQTSVPRLTHPTDELLVAYLSATLATAEIADIERHIGTCDDCVAVLTMMQRRLGMAEKVAAPVPASVAARATEAWQAAPPEQVERAPQSSWRDAFDALVERIREITTVVVRVPVLVPVAVAALALVVVVTQSDWMRSGPHELTRSVQIRERLRVTAPEVAVRAQPSAHEQILATLKSGADVEVVGERGEWYQVVLPDGRSGWMERSAFE